MLKIEVSIVRSRHARDGPPSSICDHLFVELYQAPELTMGQWVMGQWVEWVTKIGWVRFLLNFLELDFKKLLNFQKLK